MREGKREREGETEGEIERGRERDRGGGGGCVSKLSITKYHRIPMFQWKRLEQSSRVSTLANHSDGPVFFVQTLI